jgi:hypothetical protein
MPRHPAIALVAAALLAYPWPSQAQFMSRTPLELLNSCTDLHILQRADSKLSLPIAAALADGGEKIAFRACTDEYGENVHYLLRSLSRHQNGICEAKETEIFLGGPKELFEMKITADDSSLGTSVVMHNVTGTPPAAWTAFGYSPKSGTVAFATEGNCPAIDDARYIATTGVPDRSLKQIQEFWRQTTASPEEFDQALGNVPFEIGSYRPWVRLGQKGLLGQFREAAMAGKEGLYSITCQQNTCTASFGFSCSQYSCWLDRWIEFATGPQGVRAVRQGGYLMA